jgi:ABC-2 type transport system ATP-binding protein
MYTPEPVRREAEAAVAVRGLTKRFQRRPAIEDFSLTLAPGEICGLAGANGGGKSSTIRLLAGLLTPDEGGGSVLGHDLLREPHRVRRKVGYLAQHNTLYSALSVRENLRFRASIFGLKRPAWTANEQLRAFGLSEFATIRVGQLSGGWLRQVQLAAALIHRPQLLLLDEPTVGLDPAARHAIWRSLTGLATAGTAIILSTHDLAEAERCSQVLLLSRGRVRAQGSPPQILAGIEAAALFVSGPDTLRLAALLDSTLVMAADPVGTNIRIVVARQRVRKVEALLSSQGYQSIHDALTLEDAALVVAHRARNDSRGLES